MVFSSPPNQCGTSQSTPFGASVLTGTPPCIYPPFGNSGCRTPLNPPPLGQASLLAHYHVSTPLWEREGRLAHCPVSGSDTIWNAPSPPLTDIFSPKNAVLFFFTGSVAHWFSPALIVAGDSTTATGVRWFFYY
ncbi:hypothetical protein SDJN02_00977, partial [Cucurbita argyrosperma subsp. argyrosperma]